MISQASNAKSQDQADDIMGQVNRDSALVPYSGEKWSRWYDVPYKLIWWLLTGRLTRRVIPQVVRAGLTRLLNALDLYNSLEREKIKSRLRSYEKVELPMFEAVEQPAIWVCEIFTPSTFGSLRAALSSRGWPRRMGAVPGDEIENQLRRLRHRRNGFAGPIGSFLPPRSRGWSPDAKREALPSAFAAVSVYWEAIGPSTTAVVAEFQLTSEARKNLDSALRQEHTPRIVKVSGRRHLYQHLFQGINEVQEARSALHSEARAWLAKKLPGTFAEENHGQTPVLDLTLTHLHHLEPSDTRTSRASYLRALGVTDDQWELVVSPDLPGFVLHEYHPERGRQDTRGTWILQGNYYRVLDDSLFTYSYPKERTSQNIAYAVGDSVRALIVRLALFELISMKERSLSDIRDTARELHGGHRPVRSVKRMRRTVLANNIDLAALKADLSVLTKRRWRYEWQVPRLTLTPGPWQRQAKPSALEPDDPNLLKKWAARQRKSISDLSKQNAELIDLLNTTASLTSAISNIRTQRIALSIAGLSFLVAVVAAVAAIAALR